uniref:Atg6 n=1 Tax=Arundo donax TaxID=35708 RepID=A0A0A9CWG4_ARUDO
MCFIIDVRDSWIASQRVNLDPVLKFRGGVLSHGMQQKCSLTPSSIYLIPLNLRKATKTEVVYCSESITVMRNIECIIQNVCTL